MKKLKLALFAAIAMVAGAQDIGAQEFKPDPAQVELKGHKGWIYAVGFGEDGKTLVSTSRDGTAKLWDVGNAKELGTLKGSDGMKSLIYRQGTAYIDGKPAGGPWHLMTYDFKMKPGAGNAPKPMMAAVKEDA